MYKKFSREELQLMVSWLQLLGCAILTVWQINTTSEEQIYNRDAADVCCRDASCAGSCEIPGFFGISRSPYTTAFSGFQPLSLTITSCFETFDHCRST